MSTSLADQLNRLAAPQTSILADSKKRPSILFDLKEAANKDRETIYEIGVSGLEELIEINQSFLKFELTLFDRNSITLERSVELADVNAALDKTIHSFFLHLSPYFLLQPAHRCLEWLIRRYHIHEFNRDKFMMLILPYHETNIFVRCVQLLKLSGEKDMWYWLNPIKKQGIHLSKQILFNQAATNPAFLDLISKTVLNAVKILGMNAYVLQTFFGFYCTTIIGALESTKLSERMLVKILPSILKGLISNVVDFAAATYMITAELLSKFKFESKLLDVFVKKISNSVNVGMQIDAIMLLTLIYETQNEQMQNKISDIALQNILKHNWFPMVLGQVASQGVKVISLYVPILLVCLKKVQLKDENWLLCKNLLESLVIDVSFNEKDGETIIRHALNSYILREKHENNFITIESDDENEIEINDDNSGISIWYSGYLRKLERQYPESFDIVIKEIMKEKSDSAKSALKTVLRFLFKAAYIEDNTNLFENLYHHLPTQRALGVKYLVNNFGKLTMNGTDGNDIFKDSIKERLQDDNPEVVFETLKFQPHILVNLIGDKQLIEKLTVILLKCLRKEQRWSNVTISALKLITSMEICSETNNNAILLALFPFLFPTNKTEVTYTKMILKSNFIKYNKFLAQCATSIQNISNSEEIINIINSSILKKSDLPEINSLIETIESIPKHSITSINVFYNILLLSHALPMKCDSNISIKLCELIVKYFDELKVIMIDKNIEKAHNDVRNNAMPVQIYFLAVNSVLECTNFTDNTHSQKIDFTKQTEEVVLILTLYKTLLARSFTESKHKNLYNSALANFFRKIFPKFIDKIQFMSNFLVGHYIAPEDMKIQITPELQLRTIRLMKVIIEQTTDTVDIPLKTIIKIFVGLTSEMQMIRIHTIELLETISKMSELNKSIVLLIEQILQQREELKMDHEQFALILFTIMAPNQSVQRQYTTKQKKAFTEVLEKLIQLIADKDTEICLQACSLEIIKHINNVEILRQLSKCGVNVYDCLVSSPNNIMNFYQGNIIRHIIVRFNKHTVKSVTTSEECWAMIASSLRNHKLLISYEGKLVSPATILLNIIDQDLYDKLSNKFKSELIRLITFTRTYSEDPDIALATSKAMKKIDLNAELIVDILVAMKNVSISVPSENDKKLESFVPSTEMLNVEDWKRGLTLLEFIQNKKRLENCHLLISHLFDILKKCLEFEERSSVEYAKQMILSCILHCCQKLSPDGTAKRNIVSDNIFRIDLVVQCIRATQNPQTHHHALLLLCHTASMIPEQVLHNMMDIFTFMGSSVLRHDDAYSFQIISKIIDTVIPLLVKSNENLGNVERDQLVIPVLKVFSDIILDVPDHRRTLLYIKLLQTLDPSKYLWMFFAILFESHIVRYEKENHNISSNENIHPDDLGKRVEFALAIGKEFEPHIAIETCTKLMIYLRQMPADRPKNVNRMDIDITDETIFIVEAHSSKQLRHYKYVILQFINSLTTSPQLVNKIATFDVEGVKKMKSYYQQIIIQVLMYIPAVSKSAESYVESSQQKYWKVMLHYCYDILDNAISLLSVDTFIIVVEGLLQHALPAVRKKVIELLNSNLQHKTNFANECDKKNLIQLIYPLKEIIKTLVNPDDMDTDNFAIHQTALIAIKLLSKILALDYPVEFNEVLEILLKIVESQMEIPNAVLASAILCMTEVSVNLKAHVFSSLPRVMVVLIDVLKNQKKTKGFSEPLFIASLSSIQKIIESIPLFLSPYLVNMIKYLTKISAAQPKIEALQHSITTNKLTGIYQKMALLIPARILIPTIEKVYDELVLKKKFKAIEQLMGLLSETFVHITNEDINNLQNEIISFFLKALQLRSDNSENTSAKLDQTETCTIKAFVVLILKFSETRFKPLYHKIYDWAIRESNCKGRWITFYSLSNHIAEALKSIFTLFAGSFIENAANLLSIQNTDDVVQYENDKCNLLLLENILKTLYNIFLYDNQNFMNVRRFDILLQPIVDQIENPIVLQNANIKAILISCLAQLAEATNDDSLWKQLNYQVLLKTRNSNRFIKQLALQICVEIAKKLGERYLLYLPETIPFLSELLEDEHPEVERSCQRAVQSISQFVGEPLQKYF